MKRLVVISILAAGFVASSNSFGHDDAGAVGHGSEKLHEQMMSGMQSMQAMKPSGDTDKDFVMMMRMHHEQAVTMAKTEVEQGKSPELKAMAKKMISGQQKEIGELDKWMAAHR